MKKKTNIIIGVIVGIAVVIIVVSFFFPGVYQGLTKGTIGKAEKYRQDQMSENDILFRSEFTEDTAQLRQMISGLIYFTVFTENLSATIDSCLVSFNYQGFDKNPANKEAIRMLGDYNTFMKNNTQTLANTTRILADIFLGDTVTLSLDVEKNLRDFAIYVDRLNQKDSMLMLSMAELDHFLIRDDLLKKNQEALRNLKATRDQLLIKSVQLMAMTNNKSGLGSMLSYALQGNQFMGVEGLQSAAVGDRPELSSIASMPLSFVDVVEASGNLNSSFIASSLVQAAGMGSQANAKPELTGIVIYDKPSLSFILCSEAQLGVFLGQEGLNNILQGQDANLGVVGVVNNQSLGIVMNAAVLGQALNSQALNVFLSADQLNVIIPATELAGATTINAALVGSDAPLQMGLCGNPQLSNLVGANSALQGFSFGSTAINNVANLGNQSLGVIPIEH